MASVWLLDESDWDGSYVHGVFSSPVKAMNAKPALTTRGKRRLGWREDSDGDWECGDFGVVRYEIDSE